MSLWNGARYSPLSVATNNRTNVNTNVNPTKVLDGNCATPPSISLNPKDAIPLIPMKTKSIKMDVNIKMLLQFSRPRGLDSRHLILLVLFCVSGVKMGKMCKELKGNEIPYCATYGTIGDSISLQ